MDQCSKFRRKIGEAQVGKVEMVQVFVLIISVATVSGCRCPWPGRDLLNKTLKEASI
jgi:hypothetical protein